MFPDWFSRVRLACLEKVKFRDTPLHRPFAFDVAAETC